MSFNEPEVFLTTAHLVFASQHCSYRGVLEYYSLNSLTDSRSHPGFQFWSQFMLVLSLNTAHPEIRGHGVFQAHKVRGPRVSDLDD